MSVIPCSSNFLGIGILPTSGNPGKPRGPACFKTKTVSLVTGRFISSEAIKYSSISSKTSASPVWTISSGVAAETFRTQPSGARDPFNTTIPEPAF